uniref:Uncharacterized protein n=1 Tax=Solanum tuberosum TaxID=4113 RepID=M1DQ58_SOLTU
MSVNGSNGSQVGHQDDIGNLNNVNEPHAIDPHLMGGWRAKGLVGASPKRLALAGRKALPITDLLKFRANPFGEPDLARQNESANMARPKVAGRSIPSRNKVKGISLNEDAGASKGKATKLPTTSGKGKDKEKAPASPEINSDSDGIFATHLTTFKIDSEH